MRSATGTINTGKQNAGIQIEETGMIKFTPLDHNFHVLLLAYILYSSDIAANIISIPKLIKKGCEATCEWNHCNTPCG